MIRVERFGIVLIARNEGERFKRCVMSLPRQTTVVYVDSGSTDGSVEWARGREIDVIELGAELPFTAARARNAGFRELMRIVPDLPYVQFIDGDCELAVAWPDCAISFLESNPGFVAAFGRRRERQPDKSVYNFLCDVEWNVPVGPAMAFGGDVMMRADSLQASGGYREDLIAGEDPELALRFRAAGWEIMRLDAEMTRHDAALLRFSQWWRRQQRSGFAFAEGAALHGRLPERYWVWEVRRAVTWGLVIPLLCVAATIASLPLGGWGALTWLIFFVQMLRLFLRGGSRPAHERAAIAIFQVLSRFPEAQGWLKFKLQHWQGTRQKIIEYKDNA
jgi:glycosyltransferase involved in cell wall biosynthesis